MLTKVYFGNNEILIVFQVLCCFFFVPVVRHHSFLVKSKASPTSSQTDHVITDKAVDRAWLELVKSEK